MPEAVEKNSKPAAEVLELPGSLTVKQLAEHVGASPIEVIKRLMKVGVMAAMNQAIDYEIASKIASDFGFQVKKKGIAPSLPSALERQPWLKGEDPAHLQPRSPVVTIMGHVDHGKTSLLDSIRQSNIVATEAGQITQHIGAYQVESQGQKITFLDTPGHEAFTAIRARGARATDIAVLVVAADDGVMPQTVEAADHAKAAGVPIVVAINKMDKAEADPERVKRQLSEIGLLPEEWGGEVICVPVSAKKKEGIPHLLESILLLAELAELKANPNRSAQGVVIEAKLDPSRGPVATMLVQNGTLKVGDVIVVGEAWGRIRAMFNDLGERIKRAGPSLPVGVLGLGTVPQAGDSFNVMVGDERTARALAEARASERQAERLKTARGSTLESVASQIRAGEAKELSVVLKTDVQGSIEAVRGSLERLETEQAKVKVIHAGSGLINEGDVLLALASKGIVLGFNTRPDPPARRLAEVEGVDIRTYEVIYSLVEDIQRALSGLVTPPIEEVVEGHAQVRAVFPVGKTTKVAGCYVTDGKLTRNALCRVLRQGKVVADSKIGSLKHFKEDVREMAAGMECGIGLEDFMDFQLGDVLEGYRKEAKGSQ